ncbi:GspE/PulE family protein [Megalodesulfovibrio gigas]|uniref:Putative general secretion pathway protein E n=1 Tax=Megalodesulfovibrio gigas (strain ATCC 19364 / DSM 1382 / NCIMB 9332 / VKM B-1759) TaxID=1121448 RepID=T2GCR9_MEGG1|nr:GspE/PulE family protein [Megalodesulfovibrio gigas]AGW13926.1 putative general secretion pathway protein E [Megalodesulfovibrio gigas DSM 1382 = ATCC 19364]
MNRTRNRQRIGELLVAAGCLTRESLDRALAEQDRSKLKLGQLLLQKGLVKDAHLADVLARQLRLTRYAEPDFRPDRTLAAKVPMELAAKYGLAPLERRGGILWVAMRDPTDLHALDDVVRATGLDVEPAICTERELAALARLVYGAEFAAPATMQFDIEDIDVDGEATRDGDSHDATAAFSADSLTSMAEDAPVVKMVNAILVQAQAKKASDIHLSKEQDRIVLRLRIDGQLVDVPAPRARFFLPLVSRFKLLSNLDISVSRVPQDGRFTFTVQGREIGVRTSTIPTIYGEKVVMRLHEQHQGGLELEHLGMADVARARLEQAILKPHGIILATGPTGSGKTTLLYAVLRRIKRPGINIITLEDPVESRVEDITQIQLNSKAGMTFASGLRSILRQDPDVIMVGEIRDTETATIAIKSSMTGHKVISTLHTNDAPGALTRLFEMGVDPFLVSSCLQAVVAQRLVRRLCPDCLEAYEAPLEQARHIHPLLNGDRLHFFRGTGCWKCDNAGFRGRLGVYEVLEVDGLVQEHILRKASSYEVKEACVAAGTLRTLKMDAGEKVLTGLTSFEEFVGVAY